MNEQLKKAIQERIKLGNSSKEIIDELVTTGYEYDEAKKAYDTVVSLSEETVSKEDKVQEEDRESEPQVSSREVAEGVKPSQKKGALKWVISALLIVLCAVAAALFTLTDYKQWMPFLSEAPYDERTLLFGILREIPESYAFSNKFELSLEPREVDTPSASAYAFEKMIDLAENFNTEIPDEASLKALVEGRVEIGEGKMRSDITGNVEMLFDLFNFKAGGSLVQINKEVYGKIDKLPSMVQAGIGEVPMNTWIKLTEKKNIEDFNNIPLLFKFDDKEHLIEIIKNNLFSIFNEEIREALVQLPTALTLKQNDNQQALVASVANALNLFPEKDRAEAEEVLLGLAEIWNQNPFLAFSEKPKKQEVNNEMVYSYFVEIDIDSFVLFLTELDKYAVQKRGKSEDLVKRFNEEVGKEFLEKFNDLITIRFDITPEGSLYRTLISSKVTSPDQAFDKQLNFKWETILTQQNEVFNITAPDDVYPQTLEEIIEAESIKKLNSYKITSIKQTLANHRSQAELFYNQNNLSYAGYCESGDYNALAETIDSGQVCNSSKLGYVIVYDLPSKEYENYWCVDSVGFAGVPVSTDSNAEISLFDSYTSCAE
jgi:hypothetical protein